MLERIEETPLRAETTFYSDSENNRISERKIRKFFG